LLRRDVLPLVLVVAVCWLVSHLVPDLNFFGTDGVVDRIGTLTSTLTGFYVAALVAAATFASSHAELDEVIKKGKVYQLTLVEGQPDEDYLTRREYVCAIFGYVSISALLISISSILIVSISDAVSTTMRPGTWTDCAIEMLAGLSALIYMILVFHLIITTAHGLYYLSYRLYIGEGAPVDQPWGDDQA
jgi:hypothetical protein